ncbi:MAG: hypothetical protein ACOYBL_10695 [Lachnospiraceae bacterium]|jgi:hypothetical protein
MSKEFVIHPLEGIVWDEGKINLGDSKESVIAVLGEAQVNYENSSYYFSTDLRIDYDKNDCVEFIEFLGGMDGSIQPVLYGQKILQINAARAYKLLKDNNNGEIVDEDEGRSYNFKNIGIGVFRENTPDIIDITMTKLTEAGIHMQENEKLQEERRLASHWATIGLGGKDYYE